jgi:hypothetical protein
MGGVTLLFAGVVASVDTFMRGAIEPAWRLETPALFFGPLDPELGLGGLNRPLEIRVVEITTRAGCHNSVRPAEQSHSHGRSEF